MTAATEIAEAIVDRFLRGEIDEEGLEEAIAAAIRLSAPSRRPRTDRDREVEKASRAQKRADPARRDAFRAQLQAAKNRHRARNVEQYRAKERAAYRRARDRDPEAFREKQRLKGVKRRVRNTPADMARSRRKFRKLQTPEQQAANAAIVRDAARKALPPSLPPVIRDDVIAAVLLAYTEGRITIKEAKAEAKKALTAHNRMFDTFKVKSLDTSVPGTENLQFIDTIADDHPKF